MAERIVVGSDGRKYITHEPAPQRQPEPVGWIYEDDEGRMMFSQMPHPDPLWEPVYRARKQWQGLTDMEAEQIIDEHWEDLLMLMEAIEARLKAKNG